MKVAVIGLGLIGGSLCRSIKLNINSFVFGSDKNQNSTNKALSDGAIDKILEKDDLKTCDFVFVCLPPRATLKFIEDSYLLFKQGAVVVDVCGVKKVIAEKYETLLEKANAYYVGGHPMAGKETSGYDNSSALLFNNASFILTKTPSTNEQALKLATEFVKKLGSRPIVTSAENHDKIIAYTSQLAHIVSSAFVKSPTAKLYDGFTGGSFQDLTRVAYLDENLWTELFLYNSEYLTDEIDHVINNLIDYKKAIQTKDEQTLKSLLKDGKEIKSGLIKK